MAGSDSIVDWNALSLNEGIELAASMLRRHLGVRLFIVTGSGESIDVTPPYLGKETVFDHFVDTDARWGEGEERATMVATRRQWASTLQGWRDGDAVAESVLVETRPGFSARLFPIEFRGEMLAALVVAGYVPAENAASRVESIRRVLPDHLDEAIAGEEEGPEIIQMSRQDQRWLDRFAQSITTKIVDELESVAPSCIDESSHRFAGMLGRSDAMIELFKKIEKIARSHSSVLITGENGTGKELVARAIHRLGARCEEPFLAVNCAAIPEELIASELFGHRKGAFSGAHRDRQGLFEAADGGTLLLDEIGDMEKSLQAKLLRVLQENTLVRVGDTEVRKVDVRVLCATNTDLEKMVRRGRFRRDLYFRIRVMKLAIPPLRERREDIELLAKHFISGAARRHGKGRKQFSEQCLQQLRFHDWPGNVRELENTIERLVIMSGNEPVIEAKWLSQKLVDAEEPEPTLEFEGYQLPEAIEFVERKMIRQGLERTGWNKTQTARELGVSRRNLIRKVARYELEEDRE